MTERSVNVTPLNVFLIGAQKAGTTTLAALLNQHPDICLATPKETDYFSRNFHEGPKWFDSRFEGSKAPVRLDASPSYSMASMRQMNETSDSSSVPERIREYDAGARIIYILRPHADRVHSAYWHNVRGGNETLGFREAFLESDEYLAPTLYCQQLDLYHRHFTKNQILILNFQDLKRSPVQTAIACIAFVGLAEFSGLNAGSPKNQSFQYTPIGQAIRTLAGTRDRMKLLTRAAKRIVPARYWDKLKSVASNPVPKLLDEDRKWLEPHFDEDKKRLQRDYNFSFEQTGEL
jgi:hypothetical protein